MTLYERDSLALGLADLAALILCHIIHGYPEGSATRLPQWSRNLSSSQGRSALPGPGNSEEILCARVCVSRRCRFSMRKVRGERRQDILLAIRHRFSIRFLLVIGVLGAASFAVVATTAEAHNSQPTPSAICQSGEICLWMTQQDYYDYSDDPLDTYHATWSGSDSLYNNYYASPYPNTEYIANNSEVAVNRGEFCHAWLYDHYGWDPAGWEYFLPQTSTRNPLPPGIIWDASSHHWCVTAGTHH